MDDAEDLAGFSFFVKICTEKHSQGNPRERITFAEISRSCRNKWKELDLAVKQKFIQMASEQTVGSNTNKPAKAKASTSKEKKSTTKDTSSKKPKKSTAKAVLTAISLPSTPEFDSPTNATVDPVQPVASVSLPRSNSTSIVLNAVKKESDDEFCLARVMSIATEYKPAKIVKGIKTVRLRNAYSFFFKACQEARRGVRSEVAQLPFCDFSIVISQMWHKLSPSDKALFERLAEEDKRRLEQETLINGPPKKKKKRTRARRTTNQRTTRTKIKTKLTVKTEPNAVKNGGAGKGALFLKAKQVRKNWETTFKKKK